jgi:hypothetical protein
MIPPTEEFRAASESRRIPGGFAFVRNQVFTFPVLRFLISNDLLHLIVVRKIFALAVLLVLSPVMVWSQSTLNFPVPADAGPAGYAVLNSGPAAASVTFTAYADAAAHYPVRQA